MNIDFLKEAITVAVDSAKTTGCGPFGAVIVREQQIVGTGNNQVTLLNDPTAHAEVMAIRKACQILKTFSLEDCVLYSSCEPCPMCLGAILWARIGEIYFAADRYMAQRYGFDDQYFYQQLNKPNSHKDIILRHEAVDIAAAPFMVWESNPNKKAY